MITLLDIQALKPCWTSDKLTARVPANGVSYMDIVNAKDVSVADRRWLLTQLAARTREGRNLLILWSAECAQSVQGNIPEGPLLDAALAAIAAAVACAENNTEETRSAAWSAAWSAWSAARSAESAARSAARSAESAAWSAESAESAAWSAARSAESAAEEAQLLSLATTLEGALV